MIPVIIGATGTISKSLIHYVSNILRKHEIEELQKVVIFGAARILRRVTDVKVQNIFYGRNYITCSTNCKYRTATILHAVETPCVMVIAIMMMMIIIIIIKFCNNFPPLHRLLILSRLSPYLPD